MLYICHMKLFLDDNRQPYDVFLNTIDPDYESNDSWSIVRSYDEFVSHINEFGLPKLISFDHDLDMDHYLPENQSDIDYSSLKSLTGYDCAIWLVEYCDENGFVIPNFKVHSQNPVGKDNIIEVLSK